MKHTSRYWATGIAVVAALGLAACGGNTSAGSGGGGAAAPVASADASMAAKGQAAAEKAGGKVALPDETIGFIYYGASGIASQRSGNGLKAAAEAIGWKVTTCDGQGIPAEMQRCASNLLNQGVNALVVNTIDTATMADAIKQAKSKNVPIVAIGGALDTIEGYAGNFAPDETGMGTALADYIVKTLGGSGGVVEQKFQAKFATLRTDAQEKAFAAGGVKVVATFDADPADLTAATQRQTSSALSAHSDAKAVTMVFSTAEIGATQSITQRFGAGKSFPDRPLLTTYYANLPTIDMIRKGQLDAAVENPLEWTAWVAIDQLAEFFARKTPVSTEERPNYGDGLDFWRATVVTKDNLPAEGQYLAAPVDFSGFFGAKWTAEFGA